MVRTVLTSTDAGDTSNSEGTICTKGLPKCSEQAPELGCSAVFEKDTATESVALVA